MDVDAADRLYSIYADEINRENADLKAHRAALDDLMRRALSSGRESRDRAQAFRELQNITLDSFWNAEPREINQLLHRLLGRRRLVVLAGQVVGIADTPRRKG
jgi:hypothetical protein